MQPLVLTLLLFAPDAMIRVPPKAPAFSCPVNVDGARSQAIAFGQEIDRAVLTREIIGLASLANIEGRGTPTLPPSRRAFLQAVDCLLDRGERASGLKTSDASLAMRSARIALAYRRPDEAISRLEFVENRWPNGSSAEIARALMVQISLTTEGELSLTTQREQGIDLAGATMR